MIVRLSRLLLAATVAAQPLGPAHAAPEDARPGGASPPAAAPPTAQPAAGAKQRSQAARKPLPPAAVLEEVAGTVSAVDREAHRIDVATDAGPVELWLDRNTLVYTARGVGTVLDLAPGVVLRAGRNAGFVAYWIQVRSPSGSVPSPAPGTGPGGGSGAAATEGGGAPGGAPSGTPGAPGGTAAPGGASGGATSAPPTGAPPGGSPPDGGP
jgi:hypothetical protein